jgi:CRISPR type III-B/RAMP module-associated protein Cmr5
MSQLINIEQIRAKNALGATNAKKQNGEGDNLSGYPSLIMNNGLIPTIAFSIHKEGQHERIADAIACHLNDRAILSAKNAKGLRDALCNGNASMLQRATHEALQFLSYLKRFQRG